MDKEEIRYKLIRLVVEYGLDYSFGGMRMTDAIIMEASKLENYVNTGDIPQSVKNVIGDTLKKDE